MSQFDNGGGTMNIISGILKLYNVNSPSQYYGIITVNSGSSLIFIGDNIFLGIVIGEVQFENGNFVLQTRNFTGFTAKYSSISVSAPVTLNTVTLNTSALLDIRYEVTIKNFNVYVSIHEKLFLF